MKRITLFITMVLLSFSLYACAGTPDTVPPVLTGVTDITIFVGEAFDPLAGVQAIDDVDGDITQSIRVSGAYNVDVPGSYFLRYVVEDAAGNRQEATRYLNVVIDPDLLGDAMVPNGDFSLGWAVWSTTTGLEGGNATYTVVDGELKVDITSVAGGLWEPRLENIGITFEQGKNYKVEFQARAEQPRAINIQVGELLASAPWFTDFKPGQRTIFDLTTEMQTFSFVFNMSLETNDNGALIFEKGTVPMSDGTNGTLLTTVYFDNISIIEVDEFVDETPPLISGAENTTITVGSSFNPLAGVSVVDNVDGEMELTLDNVTGTVDVLAPGDYTLTYTISDEAGNEAVVVRVVTVVEVNFIDSNQIVDGSFETTTEIPAEVQDPDAGFADITEPGFWYSYIADWDGAVAAFAVIEGALTIDITAVGGADWSVMLKQKGLELEANTVYKLVFSASASEARNINVLVGQSGRSFNLTSELQEFEFIFVTAEDGAVENGLLTFLLGNTTNFNAGLITLKDITLFIEGEEATSLIFQDTGELVDGTFETTTEIPAEVQDPDAGFADITEPGFWYSYIADWDGAVAAFAVVEGAMTIDVSAPGNHEWGVMLKQKGVSLVPGTIYQLSFTAHTSVERDLIARVTNDYGQTFQLTTTPTEYSFSFLYEGGALTNQTVLFLLGNTDEYAAGVVTIDNVVFASTPLSADSE